MHDAPPQSDWPIQQPDRRPDNRFQLRPVEAQLISDIFIDTVRLVNIGRLGFSVRSFVYYEPGCDVTLSLHGFASVAARVVWFSRGQVGARFIEPMDEETLLSLILGAGSLHPVQTDRVPTAPPVRVHSPGHHPGPPEAAHRPSP